MHYCPEITTFSVRQYWPDSANELLKCGNCGLMNLQRSTNPRSLRLISFCHFNPETNRCAPVVRTACRRCLVRNCDGRWWHCALTDRSNRWDVQIRDHVYSYGTGHKSSRSQEPPSCDAMIKRFPIEVKWLHVMTDKRAVMFRTSSLNNCNLFTG
jgi:hypothetical protein